jgi:hypothetical protein
MQAACARRADDTVNTVRVWQQASADSRLLSQNAGDRFPATLCASCGMAAKRRKSATRTRHKPGAKWSARVTQRIDALDLERGVFTKRSARAIAMSLTRSAERSKRRKSGPYRSAMSMLTFEINRAGRNLSAERRRVLTNAKAELRKLFA